MVSVIVPVYNAEAYLNACIKSLAGQTYSDMELILVDDCSTDGSAKICEEWRERDRRIRTVYFQENRGPAAARNQGMALAQGTWVMFVDADDWVDTDCIEVALREAERADADIVMWDLVNHCKEVQNLEKALKGDMRQFQGDEIPYLQEMLLTGRTETGSSAIQLTGPVCKLYKTSVIRFCSFPEKLNAGEDACFVMQALQRTGRFLYCSHAYYHRMLLETSLSQKKDAAYVKRRKKYVNWMLKYCLHERIGNETTLNDFIYVNFKEIVGRYVHIVPTREQFYIKLIVEGFLDGLAVPLRMERVNDEDSIAKWLLRRKWYYLYKVRLVWRNLTARG